MLPAWLSRSIVGGLDWLAERVLPPDKRPTHQRTGIRGEEDAYFHLRSLGYVIVARNYRTARVAGGNRPHRMGAGCSVFCGS